MADRVRYRLRIHGKVQGVFFRKYAQMTAQSLKLVGFVRNEPGGSVYVEVEGLPEVVESFVQWAHRGSPAADVKQVEIERGLEVKNESEFRVIG